MSFHWKHVSTPPPLPESCCARVHNLQVSFLSSRLASFFWAVSLKTAHVLEEEGEGEEDEEGGRKWGRGVCGVRGICCIEPPPIWPGASHLPCLFFVFAIFRLYIYTFENPYTWDFYPLSLPLACPKWSEGQKSLVGRWKYERSALKIVKSVEEGSSNSEREKTSERWRHSRKNEREWDGGEQKKRNVSSTPSSTSPTSYCNILALFPRFPPSALHQQPLGSPFFYSPPLLRPLSTPTFFIPLGLSPVLDRIFLLLSRAPSATKGKKNKKLNKRLFLPRLPPFLLIVDVVLLALFSSLCYSPNLIYYCFLLTRGQFFSSFTFFSLLLSSPLLLLPSSFENTF